MTYGERRAWFEITVAGVTIAVYGALSLLLGSEPALAAFGILGLTGLAPKRKGGSSETRLDERDVDILQRSSLIGYSVFWLTFVAGTMGLWALGGEHGSIPVDALPLFPLTGWMVLMLGRSLATLVLYARGR